MDFSKPRKLSTLLLSFLFLVFLGSAPGHGQQTDDEQYRRDLFLKSRQKMEVVPSPTPTPRPTPVPAEPPVKHTPTPEPSVSHPTPFLRPSPSPSPKAELRPVATPELNPQTASTPVESRTEITPASTPKKKKGWFFWGKQDDVGDSIVIQKSGAQGEKDLVTAPGGGGGRWQFLTPAIRQALDQARVSRNRWKYIIVHNSGTRQGNARIFDYYHRHVRKMPNGLAYHFVIGNGSSSGNGQIETGDRWTRQLNGGHVHSDYLNYISLGICLVGDFNRDVPTKNQYLALDELIRYLRQRVGKVDNRYSIVRGHKEINPRPTDCPGARFPLTWLHRTFPD